MGNDIILVRHAHTAQVGPDAKTWPLSEHGRTEAARLARWSGWRGVTAIVTSSEAKAMQTADAITGAHPHLVTLSAMEALGEVDRRGTFVTDYEGAVADFFAMPDAAPHGWEPAADARARITAAIAHAVAPYPAASVAIVSHGLALTLYLSTLVGGPPADVAHWRTIPFTAVARVARSRDGTHTLLQPFIISPT